MRHDTADLLINYMFEPPEKRKELTENDQQLLLQVTDCYHLQLQNPMYSREKLRNYLMENHHVSRTTAYYIIALTRQALGNVESSAKEWVKQKIEYLLEKAYIATVAKDFKTAQALTKIAETYGRTFKTDIDEGELLEARKALRIENITIVTDPGAINIRLTDKETARVKELMRKYDITDADYTIIDTDNQDSPIGATEIKQEDSSPASRNLATS